MGITGTRFELAGQTVSGTVVLAAAGVLVLLAAALVLRRTVRRRHAATAAQAEAVAQHERSVAAYRDDVATWHRRRDEFRALLEAARAGGSATAPEGVVLQPGERVYLTTTATLEGQDGAADLPGTLTVTSRRLVMVTTDETHTFELDAIAQVRHVGGNRTRLRPCEGCAWVGLSYDDAELTRLYLQLVTSPAGTSRVEFLRNVAQNLNDHELRRPLVPTVPAPVEGLGRKGRVAAAEWYVARTSEVESLKALVDQVVVMVPTQTALRRETAAETSVGS